MTRTAVLLCSLLAATAHAGEPLELTSGDWVAATPVSKAANHQQAGAGMVLADAATGDIWSFTHLAPSSLPRGPHEDVDALVQALFPFEKVDPATDLPVAGAPGRSIAGTAQGMHWRVCYRWMDAGFGMLSRGSAKAPGDDALGRFAAACDGITRTVDRWKGPKVDAVGLTFDAEHPVRWSADATQEGNLLTTGFLLAEHALPVTVTLALYPTPPLTEEKQRAEWLTESNLTDVRRLEGADVTGFQATRVEDDGLTSVEANVAAPGRVWMIKALGVGPTQQKLVADWIQAAVQGATFEFERPEPTPVEFERPAESATGRKKKKK